MLHRVGDCLLGRRSLHRYLVLRNNEPNQNLNEFLTPIAGLIASLLAGNDIPCRIPLG